MQLFISFEAEGPFKTKSSDIEHIWVIKVQ